MNSLRLLCVVAVGIVHAAREKTEFDLHWCQKWNRKHTGFNGEHDEKDEHLCHPDAPNGSFYTRPEWAGKVEITHDPETDASRQVWKVSGIVVPMSSTGRANPPPDPWNGATTGRTPKLDKGHVIALSLGGPDVSQNIVPQCNYWQRNYQWRHLEDTVNEFALCKYGWTEATKPHAKDAATVEAPDSCKVVFTVEMSEYNDAGEPQKYTGSVTCGSENYPFTISSPKDANGKCVNQGEEAQWTNGEPQCTAPPTVAQSRQLTPAPGSGGNGRGAGATGVPPPSSPPTRR